ncbi:hypothetical protein GCM10022219_14810 [Microbacterium oryzae]|uniref:Restriction endonuclease n=1 Tax=Microbacterium oryzae TaxID=743009 RepID=A0A6I6E5Y8_9MICO|nr:hypothetical protein [Microbacterium oryzae]QGU28197.1 hypothetical protein D7D94_11300 [Microbacterium oryzae]
MPRIVTVREVGETLIDVTSEEAIALAEVGFCRVTPTSAPGRWRATDVKQVGAVALRDLTVRVVPKTPIESIVYMASLGRVQLSIDPRTIDAGFDRSLPSALAQALIAEVATATRRGLVKGYQQTSESSSVVRGRWDVARQLSVRPGLPLPVEIDYDDYTEDIPANRLLHAALRVLKQLEGLPRAVERALNRVLPLFAEVGVVRRGAPLPTVTVTRLNSHYAPALQLARVILEAVAWTRTEGAHHGGTFLLNMANVFERFVAHVLDDEVGKRGGRLLAQDQSWWLDADKVVTLRPDVVIYDGSGPRTVADTKYKAIESVSSVANGDVYQATAYALALGVPTAHLIYVAEDQPRRTLRIPTAGVTVVVHAVGLGGTPEQLRREVTQLAHELCP